MKNLSLAKGQLSWWGRVVSPNHSTITLQVKTVTLLSRTSPLLVVGLIALPNLYPYNQSSSILAGWKWWGVLGWIDQQEESSSVIKKLGMEGGSQMLAQVVRSNLVRLQLHWTGGNLKYDFCNKVGKQIFRVCGPGTNLVGYIQFVKCCPERKLRYFYILDRNSIMHPHWTQGSLNVVIPSKNL